MNNWVIVDSVMLGAFGGKYEKAIFKFKLKNGELVDGSIARTGGNPKDHGFKSNEEAVEMLNKIMQKSSNFNMGTVWDISLG